MIETPTMGDRSQHIHVFVGFKPTFAIGWRLVRISISNDGPLCSLLLCASFPFCFCALLFDHHEIFTSHTPPESVGRNGWDRT